MTGAPCPMCRRPAQVEYRPFCSRRCADLDLQKWLTGAYAIPGAEADEDGGSAGPMKEGDED
jgi:endogenous inhibitor of DNA gyrase (YacG/DUF329 family)